MSEDLKVKLTMRDIGQLYRTARFERPPDGVGVTGAPMRGFEVASPDGQYLLTFFVAKNGDVEITVRAQAPPGSPPQPPAARAASPAPHKTRVEAGYDVLHQFDL